MQVVCGTELGSGHLQCHQVKACRKVHGQGRGYLHVAGHAQCLGVPVVGHYLSVGVLVGTPVAVGIVEVDGPWRARVHII